MRLKNVILTLISVLLVVSCTEPIKYQEIKIEVDKGSNKDTVTINVRTYPDFISVNQTDKIWTLRIMGREHTRYKYPTKVLTVKEI